MSARRYNLIINTCIVIGIGSAFFFEKAGDYKGLVGGLAILAVFIAGATYFYDRWSVEPESDAKDTKDALPVKVTVLKSAEELKEPIKVVTAPDLMILGCGVMGTFVELAHHKVTWVATKHRQAWYPSYGYDQLMFQDAYNVVWDFAQKETPEEEIHRCLTEAVEKVYVSGDDVELEVVATKEAGESSIMFRVRHTGSSRARINREERHFGSTSIDVPVWVDATTTPIA